MSVTSDPRNPSLSAAPSGVAGRAATGRVTGGRLDRAHARLLALRHAGELDRQLGAGVNPQTSGALTLRAERITRRRSRTSLANGLAGALHSAQHATPGLTSEVRPQAPELIAASSVLADLDQRLRDPEPVNPQGVALLRVLLTDAASALYQPSDPGAPVNRLRTVAVTLEPDHQNPRPARGAAGAV
jgi:hypothetical protein